MKYYLANHKWPKLGLSKSDYFRIEIIKRWFVFIDGSGQNQTILGLKYGNRIYSFLRKYCQNQTILGLKFPNRQYNCGTTGWSKSDYFRIEIYKK